MAVNVNSVYTKVLAILNKEQRGIMTPSEFNRIAPIVELSIVDKTFYELNKALNYKARGAVSQGVADTTSKIQEKIDSLFNESSITFTSGAATLPENVYKIINVLSSDRLTTYEEIKRHEISYLLSSPLTAPTSKFPCYYQGPAGSDVYTLPTPQNGSSVLVNYVKKPSGARWGYTKNSQYGNDIYDQNTFVANGLVLNNDLTSSILPTSTFGDDADAGTVTGVIGTTPGFTTSGSGTGASINVTTTGSAGSAVVSSIVVLSSGDNFQPGDTITIAASALPGSGTGNVVVQVSNSSLYRYSTQGSTDFELHLSEEPTLIMGILAYAGVVIRDPNITTLASNIIQSNEVIKQ